MNYRRVQYSIKFEKSINLRRYLNEIEECFKEYSMVLQTIPVPDNFNPLMPRVVLTGKDGKSFITFSQISIDFSIRTDQVVGGIEDEVLEYTSKVVALIKAFLIKINISKFCFMGVNCIFKIEPNGEDALSFVKRFFKEEFVPEHLYDLSQKTVFVQDSKYFVNEQIDTYQATISENIQIPEFVQRKDFALNRDVSLMIDVNNRYSYINNGMFFDIQNIDSILHDIFVIIHTSLDKWKGKLCIQEM